MSYLPLKGAAVLALAEGHPPGSANRCEGDFPFLIDQVSGSLTTQELALAKTLQPAIERQVVSFTSQTCRMDLV